ncbi:ABC transporter ATP-binding protein [Clostridia bacterium]|nr:ABC transporter ATP-binding protein [Clostridia bacterium]
MNKEAIFDIRDVTKVYDMGEVQVHALQGVNLQVARGELVVVLGASGSGKSTLLNIIGGMDFATQGEILYRGEDISTYSESELTEFRRQEVGYVFQFYNLMPALTVRENVELASEIKSDALDVMDVLKQVGLEDRVNHFPSQLSGGEQQRVAIARAIAKNPEVLLCDEPTGALDFTTGLKILEIIKHIHETSDRTILLITHNKDIAQMADRVVRMRSGQILETFRNESPKDPSEISW